MIGKFQIAASFAVIYVYAGELMPTVVRSEAMGISSFVAGIGLLIFPYINSLVRIKMSYVSSYTNCVSQMMSLGHKSGRASMDIFDPSCGHCIASSRR